MSKIHSFEVSGRASHRRWRRPRSKGGRVTAVLGVAALGVTLLAACGSSKSTSSPPTTGATGATTPTTAASSAATTAPASSSPGSPNLMPLTGSGKATGTPIKIGVTLVDQGALSDIGMLNGVKGGIYYVNNVLGGIHGHPLQVVMCNSDGTPALEVNCANKFVSDGVVAVDNSYDFAFSAELPILTRANLPVYGPLAGDTQDDDSSSVFMFGPPDEAFSVGPLQAFKQVGLTKIHLSIANVPAAVDYVNHDVNPVAKDLGLSMQTTYFDQSSVNWAVVANSMLSSNPQMVGEISTTDQSCNSLLPAVRTAGFKGPILMAGCSQYVGKYPAQAVGTYSYGDAWTPVLASAAPAASKAQIAEYVSVMKASGNPDTTAYGQLGVIGFVAFPDIWYALSQGSAPYTTTSVLSDLKNVKNFLSFMGPVDTCDHTQWPGTSSCNHSVLMLKVVAGANGQDAFQSVWPEGFHQVDASLLKP
jgi:branched-chain amino acid transport system substrate-binding protein